MASRLTANCVEKKSGRLLMDFGKYYIEINRGFSIFSL